MYLIDSARQETYAGFGFAQLLCVWFSKVKFWTYNLKETYIEIGQLLHWLWAVL